MTNSGSQTPAGFYPNPENPSGPKRWWDGQAWTDFYETPTPPPPPQAAPPAAPSTPGVPGMPSAPQTHQPQAHQPQPSQPQTPQTYQPVDPNAPHGAAPGSPERQTYSGIPPFNPKPQSADTAPGHFPNLGETIAGGWQALTRYWKPLLPICALLIALPTTLYILALVRGFDGIVYNYDNGTVSGGNDGALAANLLILVAALLLLVGSQAVAALLIGADGNTGDRTTFAAAGPAIKRGFARFLVMLGWGIVFVIALWLIMFVLVLFMLISPILLVVFGLLLLVGYVFAYVKLGFIQFAVADGENVPFARSFNVSKGRFWPVLGHIIVLGILGGIGYAILSIPIRFMVPVKLIQNELSNTFTVDSSGVGVVGLVLFAIYLTFVSVLASGFILGAFARMYRAANPAPN